VNPIVDLAAQLSGREGIRVNVGVNGPDPDRLHQSGEVAGQNNLASQRYDISGDEGPLDNAARTRAGRRGGKRDLGCRLSRTARR
jgi:hypothetical protein